MWYDKRLLVQFPHLKDFFPYLEILSKESPRGKVLISTGYLEEQLKEILLAFMREDDYARDLVVGGNAPLGTLSARIGACYALGLITDDERHNLTLIRKIRNDFAHDMRTTFETPSVVSRCNELRQKEPESSDKKPGEVVRSTSEQFENAALGLICWLIYRAVYVGRQRRHETKWPY